MLARVAVLPTTLALDGGATTEATELRCSAALVLLDDLAALGLAVVSNQDGRRRVFVDQLDAWPESHRKAGQAVLAQLGKRNRIWPSETNVPDPRCAYGACGYELALLAAGGSLEACVGSSQSAACDAPVAASKLPMGFFAVEKYAASALRKYLCRRAIATRDGSWTEVDLRGRVTTPLFRTATHAKLLDRHFGRAIQRSEIGGYFRAVHWFASEFARFSRPGVGRTFEVYTGIDTRPLGLTGDWSRESIISVAVPRLRTFERELQREFGLGFRLLLKEETHEAEMRHARYLVTDQMSILVERGMDLFWSNGKMQARGLNPLVDPRPLRDVEFVVTDEGLQAEVEARRLPDL